MVTPAGQGGERRSVVHVLTEYARADLTPDAEPGEAKKLLELQREHLDEYHELSAAQKRELIESFKEDRDSRKMGLRVNPRGRQADANSTFEKIENLVSGISVAYSSSPEHAQLVGLKCRIGVEGFYCFFKNNSEFQMLPRWFFTSPQLNRYLTGTIKRWDVETIGSMGEAFSIAGSDIMGMCASPCTVHVSPDHALRSLPPQRQVSRRLAQE